MAPTQPRHYVSVETAAERLAVDTRTIRRMIARGDLVGYRVGSTRCLRVDAAEVNDVLRPIPTVGGHDAA